MATTLKKTNVVIATAERLRAKESFTAKAFSKN